MDGDSRVSPVLSSADTILELRITRGESRGGQRLPARLFHMDAEKPSPVLWTDALDDTAFGRLQVSKLGIPWIVLRRDFKDEKSTTLGLAVRILQSMWDDGSVEIVKLVGDEWVELTNEDWGVFNAKKA